MLSIHRGHSGLVNAQNTLTRASQSSADTSSTVLDTQIKNLKAKGSMEASSKVVKTADEMIGSVLDIKV